MGLIYPFLMTGGYYKRRKWVINLLPDANKPCSSFIFVLVTVCGIFKHKGIKT
jgi:hypothetical protein